MCDGFGIAPDTFLVCLCVQLRFIILYGSSESVGPLCRVGCSPARLQSVRLRSTVGGGCDTVLLTHAFTKITCSGVRDVLSNSQRLLRQPAHRTGSIAPKMALYWDFAEPLVDGPSSQDALGLITFYTRPDEFSDMKRLLYTIIILP